MKRKKDESSRRLLFRQKRSGFPEFREEFLIERKLQVRRSRTSTRSHARSNDALHELNVAQSPTDNQFVELRQPLANINPMTIPVLILIQGEHRPCPGFKSFLLGRAGANLKLTDRAQRSEKYVAQRRLPQPAFKLRVSFWSRLVVAQHFFVLQTAQEFQLTKLLRLEPAGWLEFSAKRQKMCGQHRFKNSELLDQNARDFCAPPQQACGLVNFILRLRTLTCCPQVSNYRVQVVQQFFEP